MTDKLEKTIKDGKMYPLIIKTDTTPVNFIKFNKDGTLFLTCLNNGKVKQQLLGKHPRRSDWPAAVLLQGRVRHGYKDFRHHGRLEVPNHAIVHR